MLYERQIYTFHLKELYWSKLNYAQIENEYHLSQFVQGAYFVKPGQAINFTGEFNGLINHLSILTFQTEDVPKNFCLKSRKLNRSLDQFSMIFPNVHQNSAYLFATKAKIGRLGNKRQISQFDTLSTVNLETYEILDLKIDGIKPSNRDSYRQDLFNGTLFIFGGSDENNNKLSDLWALDLAKMEWKKVKDTVSNGSINFSNSFSSYGHILFISVENYNLITMTYDLENDSWANHTFTPPLPTQNHSPLRVVAGQDSLLLFSSATIYSLKLQSKVKSSSENKKVKKIQAEKLQSFMTDLLNEKAFADVVFKVEDQEFPANKCVLSLRCSYFKNMFSSNMMESHSHIIPIPNIRAQVFQALLQHIYFSDVELDGDVAEELFLLAHEYMLNDLQDSCQDDLIRSLNVENVIKMTLLAEKYEAEKLKKACLIFIVKNAEKVYLTQDITSLGGKILLELQKIK